MAPLTRWPLGDFNKILEKLIFKLILVTDGCNSSREIALRWTSLDHSDDKSTYWFRYWLGAVRQQAITWTNVDLDPCRHMASLGHNELTMTWHATFAGIYIWFYRGYNCLLWHKKSNDVSIKKANFSLCSVQQRFVFYFMCSKNAMLCLKSHFFREIKHTKLNIINTDMKYWANKAIVLCITAI